MKEPDAIKLFIGQVPKDWNESQLKSLFEPYGEIHSMNLLYDKSTGQHKGCGFLTFYENKSAKAAQEDLHEKRTLPGSRNQLQVKPASSEANAENRKLFVGMLTRSLDENGLRDMFSLYGTIEDITILKGPDGQSKGCAFIKYETRLQAQNAIKSLHNSQTMDGCRSAIVVKIADTEKDKLKKKQFTTGVPNLSNLGLPLANSAGATLQGAGGAVGAINPVLQQQLLAQIALPQLIASNPALQNVPGTMGALVAAMAQQQQQIQQLGQQQQQLQTTQPSNSLYSSLGTGAGSNGLLGSYSSLNQGSASNSYDPYSSSLGNYSTSVGSLGDSTMQQAFSGVQQYMSSYQQQQPYSASTTQSSSLQQQIDSNKTEGPDGANLFIYQVPPEFRDSDLMQTFLPFGNVISSKVFIDKNTGSSKGFGFVSYDDPTSAANAIASMNGFALGSKRLKVQLKRPKGQNKPY